MLRKMLGVGWTMLKRLGHSIVLKLQSNILTTTTQTQVDTISSNQNIINCSQTIKGSHTKTFSNTPKFKYKLFDSFGAICYCGDSFEEAMKKARILPSMLAIYAFDENDEAVAAVWSEYNSGIPVVKMDTLIPN